MSETRGSLLRRIRDPRDSASWSDFEGIYRPLLVQYARRRGASAEMAEEVAQECLLAVGQRISKFRRRKSFRAYLRGMAQHKVCDALARQQRARPSTDARNFEPGDAVADSTDDWQTLWNTGIAQMLRERLQGSFSAHTLQAFEMYMLAERPVEEISRLLGMSANQVYVAKSRVSRHLRERCADLIEALYGVWS